MEEADIVVVGAGSGGSAAAGRLSEGGRYRVAVLEAGGRNNGWRTRMPGAIAMQTPATNWGFETVPQPGLNGRRGYQPRGRGLGGSGAINAMLYVRGHPADYDRWAAEGATGWGWDKVLPVFRRSEANERGADALHGASGPLHVADQRHVHPGSRAFIDAAAALQIPRNDDFNGPVQAGAGLYQVTQKDGERWTAARGYLAPRDNLEVICDAHVERILFEDGRVWGVAYVRGGQKRMIRATRAVVMAGGVFGTAQTLMLSGIGPGAHLREFGIAVRVDRGAVGGNLQDHLDYVAAFETRRGGFMGRSLGGSIAGMRAMGRWFRRRDGQMTSPYAEAGAFLKTDPALDLPDVQLHFLIAIVEDHGRAKVTAHGFSCHACVLRPESRGTVRLQSLDPRVAPLIDPQFLSDPRDLAAMMKATRLMYRILAQPPIAAYGGRDRNAIDLDDDAALERLIRARADTIYHPVGTARMGSDGDAVCDPQLRVRGVAGLYVADASVMPRLIGGNTNAASVMIGERCADFVAADLG